MRDPELTESDMRHLAEMCAMVLSMLGQMQADFEDPRVQAWHRVCVSILKSARHLPSIGRHMELNPDCGYWFFKRAYVDDAFYSELLEDYRDSAFWAELVSRMAEQSLVENLGDECASRLSDEERAARVSSLEKALWNEVDTHGLERLLFLLPPEES
ncbi:MAG: hypothetical protein E7033_06455 [Akkermansiaceae bacterium]|nr:hypothetical protein [Akkermansiaceae bacterium]